MLIFFHFSYLLPVLQELPNKYMFIYISNNTTLPLLRVDSAASTGRRCPAAADNDAPPNSCATEVPLAPNSPSESPDAGLPQKLGPSATPTVPAAPPTTAPKSASFQIIQIAHIKHIKNTMA